jgi:tetratricopeptide (TPR) repeat protein
MPKGKITVAVEVELSTAEAQHLRAAEGYIELGMFQEADAELRELDPACPIVEQTVVLKLCVYAGTQQWDKARELATKISEHDPDNAQWAIWSASAAYRLESVEAAKGILLHALETHPDNANIHYNLSRYETRLEHFKTARRHLARAIQLDPRFKLVAMNDDDLQPLWIKLNQMIDEAG